LFPKQKHGEERIPESVEKMKNDQERQVEHPAKNEMDKKPAEVPTGVQS
jgi:hypothetical protein